MSRQYRAVQDGLHPEYFNVQVKVLFWWSNLHTLLSPTAAQKSIDTYTNPKILYPETSS